MQMILMTYVKRNLEHDNQCLVELRRKIRDSGSRWRLVNLLQCQVVQCLQQKDLFTVSPCSFSKVALVSRPSCDEAQAVIRGAAAET